MIISSSSSSSSSLSSHLLDGSLQSKMAEIRHLENRHNVFYSAEAGPIWIKFRRLVHNDMSTAVMCGNETRCRMFGRIQWHVISQPRITLQGAATWWIHCHDSRATCHIAGCSHLTKSMSWSCYIAGVRIPSGILKIVFRHILFLFLFLMQFRLWRAAAFVSSPVHLLIQVRNSKYQLLYSNAEEKFSDRPI